VVTAPDIPGHRVGGVLGAGGFATVYRCWQLVAADPTVSMACSRAVMLASRQGQARRLPARDWRIDVLPPSEAAFGQGSRVYRCLANEIGHQPHTSQFRR
jgi:hypothetical protein